MLTVGIDLGNRYTKIVFDDTEKKEIETIEIDTIEIETIELEVPSDSWNFMEEAYAERVFLLVKQNIGGRVIDNMCITLEHFERNVLDILKRTSAVLEVKNSNLFFISHVEAFAFFAYSQADELKKNNIVLFDYSEEGLRYHRVLMTNNMGMKMIVSESHDYTQNIPYGLKENTGELLEKSAMDELARKSVSAVYLTGEGFEQDIDTERFINYLCMGRRVFSAGNLFARGACAAASERVMPSMLKNVIFACSGRITTGIEIKISDRGVDKILRMVRPGTNWYEASCSYDFIIDSCDELEVFFSPVNSREKKCYRISLADFPKREPKTTRISIDIAFENDSKCCIKVVDRGFGEFFRSSGKIISEDISL